jgi:hypothetical protein
MILYTSQICTLSTENVELFLSSSLNTHSMESMSLKLANVQCDWTSRQAVSLIYSSGGQTVDRGQLFGWSRPLFFKIAYLKHNWRCKLGMHELSSAERNARYRRFFELLNNPLGLYQVILNLLSVSYRKICSVMRQLHNRKVSEKHLLIMVNCFSFKRSICNKRNNCTFICKSRNIFCL